MDSKILEVLYGECRYCHQIFNVDGYTEDERNENATLNCKCNEALKYKSMIEKYEEAEGHIQDLFGDNADTYGFKPVDNEIIEILNNAAKMVAKAIIRDITVKISSDSQAKISSGADTIKVQRQRTNTVKFD